MFGVSLRLSPSFDRMLAAVSRWVQAVKGEPWTVLSVDGRRPIGSLKLTFRLPALGDRRPSLNSSFA
jgi:hypothetical protein